MSMDKMTPNEAIQILDQATSQVSTTREGHVKLQTAIITLSNMVQEFDKTEEEE
jgi:hypothetical protein